MSHQNRKKPSQAKLQTKNIKSQLQQNQPHLENQTFIFTGPMTIAAFAEAINHPVAEIVQYFLNQGQFLSANETLSPEQIGELCLSFNLDFEQKTTTRLENILESLTIKDDPATLKPRPPVVTIMGHVDHGKTTLLDKIRKTDVVAGEHGGITQHLGAYQIMTAKQQPITFIDTPGHEAFSLMRAQGSQVTDIVILVVAADDGVKPQTIEAIDHAKAAGVPIIVFLNKMDKPGANPDRVKQQLSEYELTPEDWGGQTMYVEGSARSGAGISDLLDSILLLADILDLKANPDRSASGTIIEAHLDRSQGPVCSVLVQAGTLRPRDLVVADNAFGHVRKLVSSTNQKVMEAKPSFPVRIIGLNKLPTVGKPFVVLDDEKLARHIASARSSLVAKLNQPTGIKTTFDPDQLTENDEIIIVPVIIKADKSGSLAAIKQLFETVNLPGIQIKIIRSAAGAITQSDVNLAAASNALIYAFNTYVPSVVEMQAKDQQVSIFSHNVIYELANHLKAYLSGQLKPEYKPEVTGHAEVRQLFSFSKVGTIAGCYVLDGVIHATDSIRILRNEAVIYEGEIKSLQHNKDTVKQVKAKQECGLTIKNFNDIKEHDLLETFRLVEVEPNE